MASSAMEESGSQSNPRTVKAVFNDFNARRDGLIKALTTDVDEFFGQCDPEKENLCLYGLASGNWEVKLPAPEVPPDIPEPALGINFARDMMMELDWLTLVAVRSDAWLLSVAHYYGARFGFRRSDRKRLFKMINELPTLYETMFKARKEREEEERLGEKEKSSTSKSRKKSKSSSKGKQQSGSPSKRSKVKHKKEEDEGALAKEEREEEERLGEKEKSSTSKSRKKSKSSSKGKQQSGSPPKAKHKKEEDEGALAKEEGEEHDVVLCGACGEKYTPDAYWICCDFCETLYHGACVEMTPAKAECIREYKCQKCRYG